MCEILVNDIFDELKTENNRLNEELTFERDLNKVLENIKNYSIILKNNCICLENIEVFKKLNDLEIDYKLLKSKRNANKTDIKPNIVYKVVENSIEVKEIDPIITENTSEVKTTDISKAVPSTPIPSRSGTPSVQKSKISPNMTQKLSQNTLVTSLSPIVTRSTPRSGPKSRRSVPPEDSRDLRCAECDQTLTTRLDLVIHVNRHHKNVESFVCHECKRVFDSRNSFDEHLSSHESSSNQSAIKIKNRSITDYLRSYRKTSNGSETNQTIPTNDNSDKNDLEFNFMSDMLMSSTSSVEQESSSALLSADQIKVELNSGSPGNICNECHNQFDCYEEMEVHMRQSHPGLVCYQCNQLFHTKDDLMSHLTNFHKIGVEVYSCHLCNFSTIIRTSLIRHKKSKHSSETPFRCDTIGCDRAFKRADHLKCHKKYCVDEVRAKQIRDNRLGKRRIYSCDFCDFKSYNSKTFGFHRKSFHSTNQIPCGVDGCERTFNRRDNLKSHQQRIHKEWSLNQLKEIQFDNNFVPIDEQLVDNPTENPIEEQTNGDLLNTLDPLKVEYISDSDNESKILKNTPKELTADLDGYQTEIGTNFQSFANRLEKHLSTSKTRRFKCDECGKAFPRTYDLNRHKKVHLKYKQNKTKEPKQQNKPIETLMIKEKKQWKCNLCDYKTIHLATLRSHMVTHSSLRPFPCGIDGCPYSAKRKDILTKHQINVHKSRFFVCSYPNCRRRFETQLMLKQHINSHKNRFVCRWTGCQFRTDTFAKLNEHKRSENHLKPEFIEKNE